MMFFKTEWKSEYHITPSQHFLVIYNACENQGKVMSLWFVLQIQIVYIYM